MMEHLCNLPPFLQIILVVAAFGAALGAGATGKLTGLGKLIGHGRNSQEASWPSPGERLVRYPMPSASLLCPKLVIASSARRGRRLVSRAPVVATGAALRHRREPPARQRPSQRPRQAPRELA